MPDLGGETVLRHQVTDAAATKRGKRRKSSRAKHRATSQPKLQGRHRHKGKTAEAALALQVAGANDPVLETARAEIVAAAADGPADVVSAGPALASNPVIAEGPETLHGDDPPAEPELVPVEAPCSSIVAPFITDESELCRTGKLAERRDAIPAALKPRRARPSFVRWTSAASILVACLLAFGRFSDTHVSAHAVLGSIHSVEPVFPAEMARSAGLLPMQLAALMLPPASAPLLAVPETSTGLDSQNIAATIAPLANERVLARDGAPIDAVGRRIAKAHQPLRKSIRSQTAAAPAPATSPAEQDHAPLTGRDHALGRYEMRWGTARLHDDPNSDSAQGPVWDFVASAGER